MFQMLKSVCMILFLELKYTTPYKAFFQELVCILHVLW